MTAPPEHRDSEKYALDRPVVVRRIYLGLIGICVVLGLIDIVNLGLHWVHYHPHFTFENVPNFYGFYGFVGCVFLVLTAKEMRTFLMRDEDYYHDVSD